MFLTVQEWLSPSLISVANGQTERDSEFLVQPHEVVKKEKGGLEKT